MSAPVLDISPAVALAHAREVLAERAAAEPLAADSTPAAVQMDRTYPYWEGRILATLDILVRSLELSAGPWGSISIPDRNLILRALSRAGDGGHECGLGDSCICADRAEDEAEAAAFRDLRARLSDEPVLFGRAEAAKDGDR